MYTEMPQTEQAAAERQRLWLKFAWVRWVLGVCTAVMVTLLIVNVTVSENQINGCERTTQERMNTAQKDAQDAFREQLLSLDTSLDETDSRAHRDSALASATAAINIAALAGYEAHGATVEQQIDDLRTVDINSDAVKKANDAFCDANYTRPLPFVG
jgi:mannitol-specific phosphotransferase system IIBC component